ncbi:MAG: hypothetical protein LUD72_11865 [Bacteroidales bacterium]|nr:hypothetical protein [Bacteroidales bacterium]
MKKTRKFISIFAILFAIVLALSVCFFAACKGGSDDGGNSDDTGTQQGDDTGSGSGDDSGSGSGTDGSRSGSGTDDGSESGPSQTVTRVVYLATSSDVQYTTAGEAVFENGSDLEITTFDGLTYTVRGTASTMGEAEAAWYATDDVDVGTPYVVIKIAVAEGETIYFENSEKTYTNDEEGTANFDDGYIFIVCKLTFEDDKCVTVAKYDITPVEGEPVTYTVSFSGVKYPAEETPVTYTQSHTIDFNNESTYSFIPFDSSNSYKVASGTYKYGIISYAAKTDGSSKILKESIDTLATGGKTTGDNKGYFEIDLSEFEGEHVKIEAKMTANADEDTNGRSMYVSTKAETPDLSSKPGLAHATSFGKSYTEPEILTYEGIVSDNALYLTWDNNICILSFTIYLTGDVDPWENEGAVVPGPESGEYAMTFTVDDTAYADAEDQENN